ncbi:hypothetical protein CSUI_007537 [Cystoisospora suis]|uniref:Transmembrane protein n=1 Tax=Cystoisospora suis TaxID=483139 RepID=A0A2C6KPU7_9APIC|nr:hypothetical protein CSUI_007537 [Cystoisospora suis]
MCVVTGIVVCAMSEDGVQSVCVLFMGCAWFTGIGVVLW